MATFNNEHATRRDYPYPGPAQIYNPPVPFVHAIGGIHPNMTIIIRGVSGPNPDRFTVYLQQGSQYEPNYIGMCFDVRFNYGKDKNVVVRNHKQGNWGQEERHLPYFPFRPNQSFEIMILVEPHCYKYAVNSQHLLEFNHRIAQMNLIDTIRINGDVRLTQVLFQS
ncbi:galectin-9-like [Ruditapes philippinarum]|uniref:galectin-9-like n=1 Tax=Ruditapes philippinarum TaxID=129788 RepID=UPI00295AC064|nr:galectin-9-like [Ruditapes philippinarum]